MRHITSYFSPHLKALCEEGMTLSTINEQVISHLPNTLKSHCKVSSFHKGHLYITTDDPVWNTELRYSLPFLREILRKEGLYQLINVHIKTQCQNVKTDKTNKRFQIKPHIQKELHILIENSPYEPLKNAFKKLLETKRLDCSG